MNSKVLCSNCHVILILADSRQRPRKCGNCWATGTLSEIPAETTCAECGTLYASSCASCPSCKIHRVVQRTSKEGAIAPYELDMTQRRRDVLRPKPADNIHTVSRKPKQTKVPAKIDD